MHEKRITVNNIDYDVTASKEYDLGITAAQQALITSLTNIVPDCNDRMTVTPHEVYVTSGSEPWARYLLLCGTPIKVYTNLVSHQPALYSVGQTTLYLIRSMSVACAMTNKSSFIIAPYQCENNN